MKTKNQTVLITGATSGIGLELAKLFAKDKFDMVLVARDLNHLERTADYLKELGAKSITVISKDLSIPYSASEIYNTTHEKGIKVNYLVNDAGAGVYGHFAETNLEEELAIIQLNVLSLVHLTKLYLRDMLNQDEGKILQLASVASYQPTPKLAVYAATKAFILSFSDAIGTELKDTNISVTALVPGATATEFFNNAGMENTKAANEHPEDPAVVAKIGYEALMKGEPHAFAPGVKQQVFMSSVTSNRYDTSQKKQKKKCTKKKIKINLVPFPMKTANTDPEIYQLKEKFLQFFPNGFADEKYLDSERNYKWDAHVLWEQELNKAEYEKLLSKAQYDEVALRALRVEGKTNLLFTFEKMALRDAVKSETGAKIFAEGLYHYIYDDKPLKERFEKFAEALSLLPRKQKRILTWPLQTVFGFIANPKEHLLLAPKATQQAAEAYHFDFNYTSKPNWNTYKSLFAFARKIYRDISDLKPADLIDVQSFIWVMGSKEYK